MENATPLDIARRQIEAARAYTQTLLDATPVGDWFRIPAAGGASHIAWQVGHLAFAQYALCLVRVRGRAEHDDEFMPPTFRRRFSKRSQPSAITAETSSPEQIRQVFDAVHRQVLSEWPSFTPAALEEEIPEPYMVFPNKLGALLFCSHHEMLHAGQIGLIRRLLGHEPVR